MMNATIHNSVKSVDPLVLIEVIKKMFANCMDFRKQMKLLTTFKRVEAKNLTESKDFLMIIDQLEFQIQILKKVQVSFKIFYFF